MFKFRPAEVADLDRIVAIHRTAFPDARGEEARRRHLLHNRFGSYEHLVVAVDGDAVVAHAFLYATKVWFCGDEVPCGAIASVGVAPEARGRGVATALLDHLHASAARQAMVATWLFPFRHAFYRRLGYGTCSPTRNLVFSPRAVPTRFVDAARGAFEPLRPVDVPALHACYARAASRAVAWLVRPDKLWDALLLEERLSTFVHKRGDTVAGYVMAAFEQEEAHAPVRLLVRELVGEDDAALRACFGFLGTLSDQVAVVELSMRDDDPFARALLDPDRDGVAAARAGERLEHPVGTIAEGPMVRLVDAARALAARRYARDGHVAVHIEDALDPHWLDLHVRAGSATVARSDAFPSTPAPAAVALHVDRATLGVLLYGGLRVSAAVALGCASVEGGLPPELDALFAHPAPHILDPF
jgi:predicted acetyltransferase